MQTPRFRLRLITHGQDEAFFSDLFGDPEVMRWIGPPMPRHEALAAHERVCRHNLLIEPGHRYWVVVERGSGEPLGVVALFRQGDSAEFGIMLGSSWWHCGVATEVLPAVLAYGFERAGLQWVRVQRDEDEQALVMHRLLRRFGFQRLSPEGAGADVSRCHWALSRAQWRTGTAG